MVVGRGIVAAMFAAASHLMVAQEVGLTARIDSTRYRTGDVVTVKVEGKISSDVSSIAPVLKDSLGAFELVNVIREENSTRWRIQLMTIDSGLVGIPPIPFQYSRSNDSTKRLAYTNLLTISVAAIAVDLQGEIKDIKPPVSAPWRFEDVLPYMIIAALLMAGGAAYYYYRKKKQARLAAMEPPKPTIPAHKEALMALRLVEDKQLWQQGRVKEYYSEITEIVRRFFERRWGIIALELTSDEILILMKRFAESERVWKEMASLFETADLVKFAKYQPMPADHEQELRWAYEIVRAMIPTAKIIEEETMEAADVR